MPLCGTAQAVPCQNLGFFRGYLNGDGIIRFSDGTYALVGLALAVFVVVALFTSFVNPSAGNGLLS